MTQHFTCENVDILIKISRLTSSTALDEIISCYKSNDPNYLEFLGDRYFGLFLVEELSRRYPIEDVQYLFSHFNSNASMNSFVAKILGDVNRDLADFLEIYVGCLRIRKFTAKHLCEAFVDHISEKNVIYDIRKKSRNFNKQMNLRKVVTGTKFILGNYRSALKVWCDENGSVMSTDVSISQGLHLAKVTVRYMDNILASHEHSLPNPDDALEVCSLTVGKVLGLFTEE